MDRETLAGYRVQNPGNLGLRVMEMDEEQKSERRIYLRKVLIKYPHWANLSNNELDAILLYRVEKGFVVEDASGYEFYLPDNGITKDESAFRRARAMMPFEFMDKTGKDFLWGRYSADITKVRNLVNQYILNFERFREKGCGLYIFSGTKGSGKTMLACCLINEIADRYSIPVKFVNMLDLLEMTKKSFKGNDREIEALYQAGLLVLDDIGVQMSKEWVDSVLYRLVNDRYVNRKPTIYTSNIPVDSLKMDDRITDRIESTTYPLALPEESIRRAMRQQEKDKMFEEIMKAT